MPTYQPVAAPNHAWVEERWGLPRLSLTPYATRPAQSISATAMQFRTACRTSTPVRLLEERNELRDLASGADNESSPSATALQIGCQLKADRGFQCVGMIIAVVTAASAISRRSSACIEDGAGIRRKDVGFGFLCYGTRIVDLFSST